MSLPAALSKQFHDLYFGGNWTGVNLQEQLAGVNWQQATTVLNNCNTIASLVYHMHYYVKAVTRVLQGNTLDAHDAESFNHPPVLSQTDWDTFLISARNEAVLFIDLIKELPEQKLWEDFSDKKYGNYYRNIAGIIEHFHYHLGQVVILKKMLARQ